jgi:hypothetical protein
MIASTGKRQRTAYCECGARLAGASDRDLFDAAARHIAGQHPQWLLERMGSLASLTPDWGDGAFGGAQNRGQSADRGSGRGR